VVQTRNYIAVAELRSTNEVVKKLAEMLTVKMKRAVVMNSIGVGDGRAAIPLEQI